MNEIFSSDQYKSLNDAKIYSEGLDVGNTEVYYRKDMRGLFGTDVEKIKLSDYALLGKIKAIDLDDIFLDLQGERWSPNGEARNLIRGLVLSHTSMSVGDVVKVGNVYNIVDMVGFREVEVE